MQTAMPCVLLKATINVYGKIAKSEALFRCSPALQSPQVECEPGVCTVYAVQGAQTDLPGIITQGAKSMQQLQCPDHGLSRRRGQPVKLHDVVDAHGLELQHCAGQLTALHLWHTAVRESLEVLLCAQPEA